MGGLGTTTKTTRLYYYFWLPAGKDEFGFRDYQDAPLGPTAHYRARSIEETIANQLSSQLGKLQNGDRTVAGLTRKGRLEPRDADVLGLRKIEFDFTYAKAPGSLTFAKDNLTGTGLILSNGLYLWTFVIEHADEDAPISDQRLLDECRDFLRFDFVNSYVAKLFNFGWRPDKDGGISGYPGVMTYYQLDVLFNGIFDRQAHPHEFMNSVGANASNGNGAAGQSTGSRTAAGQVGNGRPTSPDSLYDVGRIIQSASLYSVNNLHRPLFDTRKDYSLRGVHDAATSPYVDTSIELFHLSGRGSHDEYVMRELVLSRLSYAAMEQFVRAAITFGLTHYRAGLDFCRAQLTDRGLVNRLNVSSDEFVRPSLHASNNSSLAILESYYSILVGKVPAFVFLQRLVTDLAEVSRPRAVEADSNNGPGLIEWRYSKSTLDEALRQFGRQVKTIKSGLSAVDRNVRSAHSERILTELTETRKIAEIEAESPPRVVVAHRSGTEDMLFVRRISFIAVIFAAIQVCGSLGIWAMEMFYSNQPMPLGLPLWRYFAAFSFWGVLAVGILVMFLKVPASRFWRLPEYSQHEEPPRVESHVFDYSFLRERTKASAHELVDKLAQAMIDLESDMRNPAVNRSSFRESPANGIERTKHSLHSAASESKTMYILHVEVERRLHADHELLREIRLVIRKPVAASLDIEAAARKIVSSCLAALVIERTDEGTIRAYCAKLLGWPIN